MDGTDPSNKKLDTLKTRAEDRIQKAHVAAVGGTQQGILPLLVKSVFKQTLARLKVPVAQSYGEADREVAALAKDWQCPVLSADSDFFIFERGAGLLPLRHFRWEEVQQNGSGSYIPCKVYYSSRYRYRGTGGTIENIQISLRGKRPCWWAEPPELSC